MMVIIDQEQCNGCELCVQDCLRKIIIMENQKASIKMDEAGACLKCGHCIAVCPNDAVYMDDYDMTEVLPYEERKFAVNPDNLLNFIKYRRSVRQFKKKPVEQEKLLKIIEAGRFTPTAGNTQGVSYIVIREKLEIIKPLAYNSLRSMADTVLQDNNKPNLIKFYANMWVQMYDDYYQRKKDRLFFDAPVVVLTLAYSPIDAALAASNMELMANALGLGCLFNGFFISAAVNNTEIKRTLGINNKKQIQTCLVIGYPNVRYFRTVPRKKPVIDWQ